MTNQQLSDDELLLVQIYREIPKDDRKLLRMLIVRLQMGHLSNLTVNDLTAQLKLVDYAAAPNYQTPHGHERVPN